jgi:iron complex outermembrane receptor protein
VEGGEKVLESGLGIKPVAFLPESGFSSLNGDLEENNWSALSPRLAIRYDFLRNLSAYASYGREFWASILDDLCRSGILWGLYRKANPELDPETIDTYEIGLDYRPVAGMKLSATFFYSLGKDFLYFVPTGGTLAGRPLYRRENIGTEILLHCQSRLLQR